MPSPFLKDLEKRREEIVHIGEVSIPFQTLLELVRRGELQIINRDDWNIELQDGQSDYDNGVLIYHAHWSRDECDATLVYAVICMNPSQSVREKYGFHNGPEIFSVLDMDYCGEYGVSAGWMGRLFAGVLNAELEERVGYSFPRAIDGRWVWRDEPQGVIVTDGWPPDGIF